MNSNVTNYECPHKPWLIDSEDNNFNYPNKNTLVNPTVHDHNYKKTYAFPKPQWWDLVQQDPINPECEKTVGKLSTNRSYQDCVWNLRFSSYVPKRHAQFHM